MMLYLICIRYLRSLSDYALEEVIYATQENSDNQTFSSFSSSSLRHIIKDIVQRSI